MSYLEKLLAILNAVLFIMSWRVTLDKEKHAQAYDLEKEADTAIRDGKFNDVINVWSRMRALGKG